MPWDRRQIGQLQNGSWPIWRLFCTPNWNLFPLVWLLLIELGPSLGLSKYVTRRMSSLLPDLVVSLANIVLNLGQHWGLGVVNSKSFALISFSTDFGPKAIDQPNSFCLASIRSCKAASKLEAPKSTLLNKSCSNEKILADLLLQI